MISPVKVWRRQKEIRKLLGKEGKIIAWTKIFIASKGFKKYAPYPVALVLLENGEKTYGQLVDCQEDDLKIGGKVRVILRKAKEGSSEGIIGYGIKFKPLS